MTQLAEKKCTACEGNAGRVTTAQIGALRRDLGTDWKVVGEKQLEREFKFKNFQDALAFTNRVGEIAEQAGHHPDIFLSWGKVKLVLSTHSAGGLTENDFILAAKVDGLKVS